MEPPSKRIRHSDEEGSSSSTEEEEAMSECAISATSDSEPLSLDDGHPREDLASLNLERLLLLSNDIFLEHLPDHLMCCVTTFLSVADLQAFSKVSRRFRGLASSNEAGWESHCRQLWRKKYHISTEVKENPSRIEAYLQSIEESRRQHVTREELIYDPETKKGTIWSFRFKESAGMDWTALDPWYSGRPCLRFAFLEDGNVVSYHDGQLRNPSFGFQNEMIGNEDFDEQIADNFDSIAVRWRLVHRPMDLPERPNGSYIRLTVADREVPTYVVHRSPTNNWGFVMESCWGVYASFPLPARQPSEEGGALTENETLNDDQLQQTSEAQWREAFLYNIGASTLPDGDDEEAREQIDQAYAAF